MINKLTLLAFLVLSLAAKASSTAEFDGKEAYVYEIILKSLENNRKIFNDTEISFNAQVEQHPSENMPDLGATIGHKDYEYKWWAGAGAVWTHVKTKTDDREYLYEQFRTTETDLKRRYSVIQEGWRLDRVIDPSGLIVKDVYGADAQYWEDVITRGDAKIKDITNDEIILECLPRKGLVAELHFNKTYPYSLRKIYVANLVVGIVQEAHITWTWNDERKSLVPEKVALKSVTTSNGLPHKSILLTFLSWTDNEQGLENYKKLDDDIIVRSDIKNDKSIVNAVHEAEKIGAIEEYAQRSPLFALRHAKLVEGMDHLGVMYVGLKTSDGGTEYNVNTLVALNASLGPLNSQDPLVSDPNQMTKVVWTPVSFSAASACVGSACGGSACFFSGCGGSACLGSACGGSGCTISGCGGSGCGGSGCAASGCVGSACGGSGCAGSGCAASLCGGSACVGSACLGSACTLSACAGSVCIGSGCGGSVCLSTTCGGSACGGSGCAVSVCVGSGCFGSVCVGTGCVGSVCAGGGCPGQESDEPESAHNCCSGEHGHHHAGCSHGSGPNLRAFNIKKIAEKKVKIDAIVDQDCEIRFRNAGADHFLEKSAKAGARWSVELECPEALQVISGSKTRVFSASGSEIQTDEASISPGNGPVLIIERPALKLVQAN